MKKRILCYTDFSDNAQNAIDYTLKLYEKQPCEFYIVNAFQADANASDMKALIPDTSNEIYQSEKKTSEAGLKKVIDRLQSNSKNTKHTFKTISSYNALLYTLKEIIPKYAIPLLVIGTKGALDAKENKNVPAIDIMEYITECSILAVSGDYKFCGLKSIVLPVNYEEALNEINFSELIDIAKLHHPDVKMLHIKKESQLDDKQLAHKIFLESILKGLKYSSHNLERKNISKGIHQFIEDEQCNLIAFIEEQSSYLGNELPKPLLKELDTHLSIPVLLVNVKTLK
ncbi:MAG: universal stress protein [Mesonia hippocampi]|uniref:universal stress protein n=1 Tax=Mesonia hippocampi TaxID=1628250 RepID=UPI003F9B5889